MKEKVMAIKNHFKVAKDRQKAYANGRRKDIYYEVGDKVLLKASPWKKKLFILD